MLGRMVERGWDGVGRRQLWDWCVGGGIARREVFEVPLYILGSGGIRYKPTDGRTGARDEDDCPLQSNAEGRTYPDRNRRIRFEA